MTPWSPAMLAEPIAAGLRHRAAQDDLEQAVYGFDHLDELGLHPLIQSALKDEGFGVWPEQRYPGDTQLRRKSHGKRCDVVLTPQGLPLRDPELAGTLFGQQPACDLEQACWLEIKTVAQFTLDGPARRYSSELLSPVTADIKKLWSDVDVRHSALLLVLFTVDRVVAEHDMQAWHRKCLERGHPVGMPAAIGFDITNRIGNGHCRVGVFGIRGM